jgi:uncharacterized membrane protein (DUF106 family)
MWLSFLLIVVVAILLGLFVNYFFAKFSTCEECAKKKKSLSAWENLQEHASGTNTTSAKKFNNKMADDILGSDDYDNDS